MKQIDIINLLAEIDDRICDTDSDRVSDELLSLRTWIETGSGIIQGLPSWQRALAEEIIDSAVNGSDMPNLIGNE